MKKLLTVLFIVVFAASLCFASRTQDAKGTSVKMFQLKVEIKDAIDSYAADYSAATGIPVSV